MTKYFALLIAILILTGCASTSPLTADLQPIDSSAIKALGYDDASQTLFVQMLSTMEIYAYQDVPSEVYDSFMDAKSKGRFYAEKIKGKYTSEK
ncbi:MAG: KTSC domain-containing protein [Kiritimatiellae bacterium]|jgi:hypothetical protein|nr:KTSC domain-containing protein [Kiritimatiellia bacterium]MDD4340954.1 KTSC domain-containing protein [Kiritimatiellia bacterium]MDY0148497.1 KTSC domain-containing protein [Kiritimatiellia bacterium]